VRTVALAIGLDPDDAVARLLPEPEPRRGIPVASLRRLAAAAAAVSILLACGFLAWRVVTRWTPTEVIAPDRGPRLRRDPVRELAEAQGLLTAPSPPLRAAPAPAALAPVAEPGAPAE